MVSNVCRLFPLVVGAGIAFGQPASQAAAPQPPPQFMSMKGFPLSCFDKPNFEQDGLEFFVCNGGGGISGVRRKADKALIIFVRNPDIAQNLQMQMAKRECGGKFVVHADRGGLISFHCVSTETLDRRRSGLPMDLGEEIRTKERFRAASKADWKRYQGYLN